MSNQKAIRDERISRIREALLELAIEKPREAYTLKELSDITGIPYGGIRSLLEHRDCWDLLQWTHKDTPVISKDYGTVLRHRRSSAVMADRTVLAEELRRLRLVALLKN